MNTGELIFALGFFCMIFSLLLCVLFGQLTVRRLRKNPETKNFLGVEFASGWDIFNAAQALALPRFIARKLAESPMANFSANREILDNNTNVFDKFLANAFYWLLVLSITLIFISSVV